MIIDSWDKHFTAKYGHQFPRSYLCFDTEFTGRSERDDLIVEIGHVLVEDGKVVDRLNLVLNWYSFPGITTTWLDYKLNNMRSIVGPGWRLLPAVVREQGIHPLKALQFYHKLFTTWASRNMPFVAQNGVTADEPMLRGNMNRFLNRAFEIPANSYFDTGAIFKANQVWQAKEQNLSHFRGVVLPTKTDTLKSYFQRICHMRIRGLSWSLKLILEQYDLIRKHNLDESQLHSAGFDAFCLHLIMEEYRSQLCVPKAELKPEELPKVNVGPEVNPSPKTIPSRTPGFVRRQRPI